MRICLHLPGMMTGELLVCNMIHFANIMCNESGATKERPVLAMRIILVAIITSLVFPNRRWPESAVKRVRISAAQLPRCNPHWRTLAKLLQVAKISSMTM